MLVLALGLHGLILLLPIPSSSPPQTKSTLPKSPPRSIKLVELTAPRRSNLLPRKPVILPRLTSIPTPTPASTVSPVPAPATPAPPENTLLPIAQPSPSPIAIAPPTVSSPAVSPSPQPPPSAASVPDRMQGLFDGSVTDSGEKVLVSQVAPEQFPDPTLFFDPASLQSEQTPRLRDAVLRTAQFDGKSAMDVYIDILVTQGQSENFQVVEKGTYANGKVYEVKRAQTTWYMNLLSTSDGTGTIIVVWQRDPSIAVQ